jgi:toxin HigB-1
MIAGFFDKARILEKGKLPCLSVNFVRLMWMLYIYNIHSEDEGMIKSIRHKGLRLFWTKGDSSKLQSENLNRIKNVLYIIHYLEEVPQDLETFKYLRPHPLKGNLKGFWSLDISGNWRVIFRFERGNAYDLDYLDTH